MFKINSHSEGSRLGCDLPRKSRWTLTSFEKFNTLKFSDFLHISFLFSPHPSLRRVESEHILKEESFQDVRDGDTVCFSWIWFPAIQILITSAAHGKPSLALGVFLQTGLAEMPYLSMPAKTSFSVPHRCPLCPAPRLSQPHERFCFDFPSLCSPRLFLSSQLQLKRNTWECTASVAFVSALRKYCHSLIILLQFLLSLGPNLCTIGWINFN